MTTKHTQRIWRRIEGENEIIGNFAFVEVARETYILCNGATDAEKIANATLISAAPELLEALDNVHKLICEGAKEGFNPLTGTWAEELFKSNSATHAAINKAKGI